MARATTVQAAGAWKGEPADVVVLDFDARAKRRGQLTGQRGMTLEFDLEQAVTVRTGDAFVLEDGRFVEVIGKPEPLMEVRPKDEADFVRIAWQLGNHHLPVQIAGKKLRIRTNPDIAAILVGMGAKITEIDAAFDPEGGAYLAPVEAAHHHHDHECCGGHHHHDHHHAHGEGCCGHDHAHDHKGHGNEAHGHHAHDHKHEHKHEHGAGCGCGHHHGHDHKHD